MHNVIIQLSAGRSISFTTIGGHVQSVCSGGFIHPAEFADAKRQATQKLADATGAPIRQDDAVFTPRRDPSGRNYHTRLIRRPDGQVNLR